jgi:hypothetical protein
VTRRPLRLWLAAAVLGPALAVGSVTASIVVPGARRAGDEVSVRLHREAGRRVRAELRPLLDAPHAANAANAELLRTATLPDDAAWRQHLWRQLRDTPEVGYLQIGFAADGEIGRASCRERVS